MMPPVTYKQFLFLIIAKIHGSITLGLLASRDRAADGLLKCERAVKSSNFRLRVWGGLCNAVVKVLEDVLKLWAMWLGRKPRVRPQAPGLPCFLAATCFLLLILIITHN